MVKGWITKISPPVLEANRKAKISVARKAMDGAQRDNQAGVSDLDTHAHG
jgi:hypothetical protein